ncbi:hypothetical protein BH10PLA1_BH10PLA1_19160 [soil metagenome]
MFSFVQNWFSPSVNPIGIDFGSDHLRMAQVQLDWADHKLLAAASTDVPSYAQSDFDARLDFFSEAVRELLTRGHFKARRAVLALPASLMYVQHVRLPKRDESKLKDAVRASVKGKLPIETDGALIRHIIAGDVDGGRNQEVIVLAAPREAVDKYLAACSRAKLDVVGMMVEPCALVDCFGHIHRRKIDASVVSMYIDLGASATRVTIARGQQILFARSIPLGAEEYNRAVAEAIGVSMADARLLRLKLAVAETGHAISHDPRNVSPVVEPPVDQNAAPIEAACSAMTARLIDALTACRTDHLATFSALPVQRLIFVGGEARQRSRCLRIAREMALTAQIGDPLIRMARASEIPIDTGIDRRLPQPAWAVAIGLSMGAPQQATSQDQPATAGVAVAADRSSTIADLSLKGAA